MMDRLGWRLWQKREEGSRGMGGREGGRREGDGRRSSRSRQIDPVAG